MMKTEQEIQEANKRERETEVERDRADRAARLEYEKATKEEWDRYEALWKPAKERWETFSRPFFEVWQAKRVVNGKAESEALAEARCNWQECPRCGASANRYQVFCTDDKCGINLLTGGTGRFMEGKWVK